MSGWLRRIGPALLALRERRGLKQYVLAERAGVTGASLSAYERGRRIPNLHTLSKILDALGVGLVDFARVVVRVEL